MSSATTPIPVVLDTDIGTDVDDALALTFALASPEIDLIGVTTVDADVLTRARMAARLLGMAGRADVPVVPGASHALAVGRMPNWFGHEGQGLLDVEWEGDEAPILAGSAAQWLVDQSHRAPYHLVAVGAFTNVAEALKIDPTLPERVRNLTVMGGMVHPEHYDPQWQQFFAETGLPPNHMDHNTACDVEATLTVARAGFQMTWVTAELTFCTTLHRDAIAEFRDSGTALGDRLARMLEIWSSQWFHHIPNFPHTARPFPIEAVAALHDPLAMASVFGGDWLTLRDHALSFAQEGDLFAIRQVVDDQSRDFPQSGVTPTIHRVSVAVDRDRFSEFFRQRVTAYLHSLCD
jgi:purine nucleosidase